MTISFKGFVDQLDELTQREKEMIAKRKAARMKKGSKTGKATRAKPKKEPAPKPEPKKTAGNTRDTSDQHIVMQLRKAQDVDGNYDIKVGPSKSVKLKKGQIDNLLKVHDRLPKPEQKRKFRIDLIRKLRKM